MKKEIKAMADIRFVVDEFYNKVRQDNLLAPIFNPILKGRWPEHLEKMYTFWQTILLGEHTYSGYPFHPHAHLPVGKEHFDRWIGLFFETLESRYEGENVLVAKRQAEKMATLFQMRIEFIREQNHSNL